MRTMQGVNVTTKRSSRAKRLQLKVSGLDGQACLTVPFKTPEIEIERFLRQHTDWLANIQAEIPPENYIGDGSVFALHGDNYRVVWCLDQNGIRLSVAESVVYVGGKREHIGDCLKLWLYGEAYKLFCKRSAEYAAIIGQEVTKITVRDVRSRWGSCSRNGKLMFCWRLIFAPSPVFDYVVAHEVAHLDEFNHSSAFWEVVARLCPEWKKHRKWLARNSAVMHSYRF